jgi:aspartate/methionine/tyrosine aminotransferase
VLEKSTSIHLSQYRKSAKSKQNLSYPIGMGGPEELLSAASNFFNQFFNPGISIMPEHVVTFTGASTALDSLLYAICDEGDSIIIPSPFWGEYIDSDISPIFG